jgi:DNA-binding NarL/FixJ family response regulator
MARCTKVTLLYKFELYPNSPHLLRVGSELLGRTRTGWLDILKTNFSQSRGIGATKGSNSFCIAWIDASVLTRECMTQAILKTQPLLTIVPFESAYDCIKESAWHIDLIVYHDHEMVSVNLGEILKLREAFISARLVVLSDASALEPAVVKDVLMQGASGFILTSQTGLVMLLSALTLVASGGTFVPKEFFLVQGNQKASPIAKQPQKGRHLTDRELEVLALIKVGKPNKLIAHELNLSQATVKVHARNLMRKTGLGNRTQLAMNADSYIEARAV